MTTIPVLRNFSQSYYELIGSSDVNNDDVTRMYNGFLACPTAGSIESFIRQSNEFADKHRKLIVKVHGLVSTNGKTLTQDIISRLVHRFVIDGQYNVDKLREDIVEIEEASLQSTIAIIPEEVVQAEVVQVELVIAKLSLDTLFLADFEAEFDRPMFVQEYFAYKERLFTTVNLSDLHTKFNETYIAARTCYLNYMEKGLGMHDFVRAHLSEFEDSTFVETLTANMVASDGYTNCMRTKLSNMYRIMYDEELHDDDFGYLIKRLKDTRVPLWHESLSMVVSDFRCESVSMGERVDACFRKVLRRGAEPDELSRNVRAFRRGDDFLESELNLRRQLIATLEFHDVAKDLIRDAMLRAEGGPREASTGQKYAALMDVLNRIQPIDDFTDVLSHVNAVVVQSK